MGKYLVLLGLRSFALPSLLGWADETSAPTWFVVVLHEQDARAYIFLASSGGGAGASLLLSGLEKDKVADAPQRTILTAVVAIGILRLRVGCDLLADAPLRMTTRWRLFYAALKRCSTPYSPRATVRP